MANNPIFEVLVIGAGPAGLASAHHLQRAGIPYRVVDRAECIASTWANLYPSLQLNTARFVSHLPGRRMPLRYKIYPLGTQLYEYLVEYAERGQFKLEFGVTVRRVTPEAHASASGWRVETDAWTAWFPAVIVASGRFNNPYMPTIPGQETYTGRLLHASAYHRAADFAGQQVVVVGNGPSGADIAAELSAAAARPVWLSIRSDIVMARRYPLGLPETVWRILLDRLPARVNKWLTNRISYMGYPDQDDLAAQYGVKFAPNRVDRVGSSAPIRGRELIDAIRAGNVRPVAGLARLHERRAALLDGTSVEADAVILGTGYRPAIQYLDFPYTVDKDGWLKRTSDEITDSVTAVAGYAGLYLVGRYYRGLGPLHNIRAEAHDAVTRIAAAWETQTREPIRQTSV
ncbi:MAG: NAD(P)/FAD-dependent oxidoreductase [Chloroflexota bacterium]|nr:NAD(P)/FAD-dependent oxidoreductase [Chloroflexota bacterium]